MAYLKGDWMVSNEKSSRYKPSKIVHGRGSNREHIREVQLDDADSLHPSFGLPSWLALLFFVLLLASVGFMLSSHYTTFLSDAIADGSYSNSDSIRSYTDNGRNVLLEFLNWAEDWGTTHAVIVEAISINYVNYTGSSEFIGILGGIANAFISLVNGLNEIIIYILQVLAMCIDFVRFVFRGY